MPFAGQDSARPPESLEASWRGGILPTIVCRTNEIRAEVGARRSEKNGAIDLPRMKWGVGASPATHSPLS